MGFKHVRKNCWVLAEELLRERADLIFYSAFRLFFVGREVFDELNDFGDVFDC